MAKILATPRIILRFPKQGFGGKHLVTNGMALRPVSQTSAPQDVVGNPGQPHKQC